MPNSSNPSTLAYRARYVFPIVAPPIENGYVEVHDGRIVSVASYQNQSGAIDLGDVALLPSLVNAHTHLEFSDLREPLGQSRMPFTSWIGEVLKQRSSRPPSQLQAEAAIDAGLRESLAAGVGLVGEIATSAEIPTALDKGSGVRFLELIDVGADAERRSQLNQLAADYLQEGQLPEGWQAGLSPHAPYTVSHTLLSAAVELSTKFAAPLAMHLAETREELQLLRDKSGPFRDLLEARGVWDPDSPLQRPLDYLQRLATAHRALVVHGNYLDAEERMYLAEQRDKLSLVYCPRTHDFFGHDRYPLPELIDVGVHVAIGTDSRASNPDLSLWNELRFVAAKYPNLSTETVLKLGTVNGAAALRSEVTRGVIQPGAVAQFAVVDVGETNAPHQSIWEHDACELDNR